MDLCVVGLGKIGLPVAIQAASRGARVRGADISGVVVDQVNAGREPFPGESELAHRLKEVIQNGRLTATTDTTLAVSASSAVIVIVPLLVDAQSRPDFGQLDQATGAIGAGLQPGTIVSFETTMPVFTTTKRLAPALAAASGLRLGEDFYVAYSPERVYCGRVFTDLRRYPKLVGGTDVESTRRGVDLYEEILQFDERDDLPKPNGVWAMASTEAAEFTKLAETTYRNVNIGLANEFARFAEGHGIDLYEVIEGSNSQPFSAIHRPGIAVGGHCIPVYPKFYLSNDPTAVLPAASIKVNEGMPVHAVDSIQRCLGDLSGLRVVVLGATYRGGVKEISFSGVGPLVAELAFRGATALVHDPMYDLTELGSLGYEAYELGEPCDVAVLQSDHDEYRSLSATDLPGVRLVYDGRGGLSADQWSETIFLQLGSGT